MSLRDNIDANDFHNDDERDERRRAVDPITCDESGCTEPPAEGCDYCPSHQAVRDAEGAV